MESTNVFGYVTVGWLRTLFFLLCMMTCATNEKAIISFALCLNGLFFISLLEIRKWVLFCTWLKFLIRKLEMLRNILSNWSMQLEEQRKSGSTLNVFHMLHY
jgi:hypothetical protein